MPDSYYGFSYIPNAHDDRYVTYTDEEHDLPADRTTDWGSESAVTHDVQQMWRLVQSDNPEMAAALVQSWRRARELVEILAQNIRRHTDTLERTWEAPQAKPEFLRRVGGTLYSLDDWRDRSDHNATYLSTVATQLETSKREVQRIYTEWANEFNHQMDRVEEDAGWSDADTSWDNGAFDDWKKQKTDEARPYMTALADVYTGGYTQQGYRFKGPTNARKPDPSFSAPPPPAAARPSGPRPGTPPPATPVGAPPAPTSPSSTGGQPPTVPGPILQGGVITPPAPPPATSAPMAPPPGASGVPAPPLPPGTTLPSRAPLPPGAPRVPGGTAPTTPAGSRGTTPPGRATARPGVPPAMQGRYNSAARPPVLPPGARTGRPAAPGAGGRPGASSAGGRPGSPATGRSGAGRGATPGVPPGNQRRAATARAATPPVIGGQRGKPGQTGAPPSGADRQGNRKPGTAGKAGASGRQAPRATPGIPQLGGRATPRPAKDTGRDARRSVRQDLGGRAGTGPTRPDTADRTAMQRRKPRAVSDRTDPALHSDEELWMVDTPGGGVIGTDGNGQEQPHDPGPTMGR